MIINKDIDKIMKIEVAANINSKMNENNIRIKNMTNKKSRSITAVKVKVEKNMIEKINQEVTKNHLSSSIKDNMKNLSHIKKEEKDFRKNINNMTKKKKMSKKKKEDN